MKSLNQISLIGNPAPDFTLQDQNGKMHSLSDYKGNFVVLYFYPKDMTSGCALEAQGFRDHRYELDDLETVVLGISADDVASHKKFCQTESLNFTLLSDPGGEVSRLYDVWRRKNIFGAKTEGIERTTFLVDKEGRVGKIYSNVKPLVHAEKLIEDLQKLQK